MHEIDTLELQPVQNGRVYLESTHHDSLEASRLASDVVLAAQHLADEVAARPNTGDTGAPLEELKTLHSLGLLAAPLPKAEGGLGFGTEPGGHLPLLRVLAAIGGANLSLGRLYEGHVNALILIAAYGTKAQIDRAAEDVRAGLIFGVWNTGDREPLRLSASHTFHGAKTFASGASFVSRPIVTAECENRGWQMTMPRMESRRVAEAVRIDKQFWHPLGMEASESFGIDFTGAAIAEEDLVGSPGDFYREPLFRGGAIRFAAVHAGAILRLHRMFAEWLESKGRGGDPYQVARLGEVSLSAQQVVLWIERAAAIAEESLNANTDKLTCERMIECANMTRLAIERAAVETMQRVTTGIGAHGLLQPSPFERILRDLTMYLRQPAPDHALAEVGRASLRKHHLRADGAGNGLWLDTSREGSLPPRYFRQIYEHSSDPWNFATSDYEKKKYSETLAILPRERYENALEIGSSIGILTQKLAPRCNTLLSVDVSELALEAARKRCASYPWIQFRCMEIPRQMPEGIFDLILVSEVAYYWQRSDLELAIHLLAEHQCPGDHLVLVHYTEPVPDYPLTGDEVHDLWLAHPEWESLEQRRGDHYRMDVLVRR